MLKKFLLVTSIFSLVGLAWLLFQFENQSRCYSSENLREVSLFRSLADIGAEVSPLYSFALCPGYSAQGDAAHSLRVEPFLRTALTSYDQWLQVTRWNSHAVTLKIVKEPAMHWQIEGREIILGEELAATEGHLFKALIQQWLLQLNPRFQEEALMLEVLSDFFFTVLRGEISIKHPFNGQRTELLEKLSLRESDLSHRQLCHSPWLPASQYAFCRSLSVLEKENEQRGDSPDQKRMAPEWMNRWSAYALRPNFHFLLWRAYRHMSLQEGISGMRRLSRRLQKELPAWESWEELYQADEQTRRQKVFSEVEQLIHWWQG